MNNLNNLDVDNISINLFVKNDKDGTVEVRRYDFNLEGNDNVASKDNNTSKPNITDDSSKKQSSCKSEPEAFTALESKMLEIVKKVALVIAVDIRQQVDVFVKDLAQSFSSAFKKVSEYNCKENRDNE